MNYNDNLDAEDLDCPKCGWGRIGCRDERTGCAKIKEALLNGS